MSEDIEEGIDASGGGFQHEERDIAEAFYRAGKTITCSHAVFPARSKSTGKWFPIVMFFDEEKTFSRAFCLDDPGQAESLIRLLAGTTSECRKRNSGG